MSLIQLIAEKDITSGGCSWRSACFEGRLITNKEGCTFLGLTSGLSAGAEFSWKKSGRLILMMPALLLDCEGWSAKLIRFNSLPAFSIFILAVCGRQSSSMLSR